MAGIPTSFWRLETQNRRRCVLLIAALILTFAVSGFAVDLHVRLVTFADGHLRGVPLFTIVAIIFGIVQSLRSQFSGTGIILGNLGAHPVLEDDPGSKVAIDVVREMALAARVEMPRIYIIEDSAPNALALGRSPSDSVICLTRGLLEQFDREELQGIVAHEIAHIRSYDIRMTTLVTVLFGTGGVSGRPQPGLQSNPAAPFLFGSALSRAISRAIAKRLCTEREYLADAAAIEFTRNPNGLIRALEHISRAQLPLQTAPRSVAPFFFADPLECLAPADQVQPATPTPRSESEVFESYANGADLQNEGQQEDLAPAPSEQDEIPTHPSMAQRIMRLRILTGQAPSADESLRELIESIHAPSVDRALNSQAALVLWVIAIGLSAGAIAGALALR